MALAGGKSCFLTRQMTEVLLPLNKQHEDPEENCLVMQGLSACTTRRGAWLQGRAQRRATRLWLGPGGACTDPSPPTGACGPAPTAATSSTGSRIRWRTHKGGTALQKVFWRFSMLSAITCALISDGGPTEKVTQIIPAKALAVCETCFGYQKKV